VKVTSVHIIVKNHKDEVLLTQRSDVPIWVIPGGHTNMNEGSRITAQREFLEETGYEIRVTKIIARYSIPKSPKMKYLYEGEIVKKIKSPDRKEVKSIGWFGLRSLPRPMTLYEKSKLNDYINYSGKLIVRGDFIDKKSELLNQLKYPLSFARLIIYYLHNLIVGTKSFKF